MATKETIKRILINQANGQLRVARIENATLQDLEIEQANIEQHVYNICNGEIVSVEPSLAAAFVNFGANRNGFLPFKEIAPNYYPENIRDKPGRINIQDILFKGQKVLVQVTKEERGTKGAALSTFITLAGCYLVLMPNNPKANGISKRIEGAERDDLKTTLDNIQIPEGMGVIVRTAGIGKSAETLKWDLDILLNLWQSIQQASKTHGAPFLIHQESDAAMRAIRDYLHPDINEIIIDDRQLYERMRLYMEKTRPHFTDRITLYTSPIPLFSRFQIERQIESIFQSKVRLPSGGEIVIDHVEALTAIDVNSAQSTKGEHIEATALHTNLEAAQEIARQLRLRDLGGLFIIDFIDMENEENNRKVEETIKEAFRLDRARTQYARISRFGLLEMSRQRLRPALYELSQIICPRCHGEGSIRNTSAQALSILRLIQENALKEHIREIRAQLPTEVATYILNEKRHLIETIEKTNTIKVVIVPNPYIEAPEYKIEYLKSSVKPDASKTLSYELITPPEISYQSPSSSTSTQKQEPAIRDILPNIAVPTSKPKKSIRTFFAKLKQWFSTKPSTKQQQRRPSKNRSYYHSRGKRPQGTWNTGEQTTKRGSGYLSGRKRRTRLEQEPYHKSRKPLSLADRVRKNTSQTEESSSQTKETRPRLMKQSIQSKIMRNPPASSHGEAHKAQSKTSSLIQVETHQKNSTSEK